MLVFASKGYFQSKNCMIELVASVKEKKPIITLIDPDASRGGLTVQQINQDLIDAGRRYERWGFESDAPGHGLLSGELFNLDPIEWNRIGAFQDVTLRLIAQRLLDNMSVSKEKETFVQGELINRQQLPQLPYY